MTIEVRKVEFPQIEPMRELYRGDARCQIIHDSILGRGWADPYLILVEGNAAGYGGVWNRIDTGRLMEFYTLPGFRNLALPMYRELLAAACATSAEAQTNIPLMLLMLYDCAENIRPENILFEDGFTSSLRIPGAVFRRAIPGEDAPDPEAAWSLEVRGKVVASGGYLCHYNPPYGDVYMSVAESERRKGYGSYIVQELKRVCYKAGKRPAARCNADNIASRKTLQKAGFTPCARLLVGDIAR